MKTKEKRKKSWGERERTAKERNQFHEITAPLPADLFMAVWPSIQWRGQFSIVLSFARAVATEKFWTAASVQSLLGNLGKRRSRVFSVPSTMQRRQ